MIATLRREICRPVDRSEDATSFIAPALLTREGRKRSGSVEWRRLPYDGQRFEQKGGSCKKITKEVVGINVLLRRSLFGDGTPRRLLRRVSLTKSASRQLRF
jgi:hypothetical protein